MKKIILLCSVVVFLFSCKKDSSTTLTETQKDQKMAEDNNIAENEADDVSIMSDEAYSTGQLQSRGGSSGSGIMGDTVKITKSKSDSTITIDFGTNGVVGKNGKTRKGKIIIKFNGGYKIKNASITQTFDNYYVDGKKIDGSRTITNLGDTLGMPRWKIESNLTITKTDGKVITWSSTRIRTMIAGYNTPLNWYDDEYTITGSASGTTSNGDTYSMTIGTPLWIKISFNPPALCKYIVDGTITYTRGSRTATIDYGYGSKTACDNQAQLNYNGTTTIITL